MPIDVVLGDAEEEEEAATKSTDPDKYFAKNAFRMVYQRRRHETEFKAR